MDLLDFCSRGNAARLAEAAVPAATPAQTIQPTSGYRSEERNAFRPSLHGQPLAAAPLDEPRDFWSTNIGRLFPGEARRVSLLVKAVGGNKARDLLLHIPTSYTDRRTRRSLAEARPGDLCTYRVIVTEIRRPSNKKAPVRILVQDSTGYADIVLFNHKLAYLYEVNREYLVSGDVKFDGKNIEIAHPDYAVPIENADQMPWMEPQWGLTAGLTTRFVRSAMNAALAVMPEEPEWIHPAVIKRYRWPTFSAMLRDVQSPAQPPPASLRMRLVYDQAFARHVPIVQLRTSLRERPGTSLRGDGRYRKEALMRFGHDLTPEQVDVLQDIDADMASPNKMLRLLQGDVGSGKTIVALLAMLTAAEAGHQSALLAPTEVLAKQHYRSLSKLSPVPVALLIGKMGAKERRDTLARIATGEVSIVIGTHAIFKDAVDYKKLGLVVIDEQHRFGVDDRMALTEKGDAPDTLVMTATPIPRTVLLGRMGWMSVSVLRGKPRGRQPIKTTSRSIGDLEPVYAGISRTIAGGGRAYWVCPLVAESAVSDLAAATERFAALKERFGDQVAIAHGQQKSEDQDAALEAFSTGQAKILVSTTVIEVGVDVPEATVIVIEHAERFGAAQLHQLRGRVGRGSAAAFCLLLHVDNCSFVSKKRIELMCKTQDGFAIADADLRLRGGGDMIGRQQSGQIGSRVVEEEGDQEIIDMARRDVENLFAIDPGLTSERGFAARRSAYIFGFDSADRYAGSG